MTWVIYLYGNVCAQVYGTMLICIVGGSYLRHYSHEVCFCLRKCDFSTSWAWLFYPELLEGLN